MLWNDSTNIFNHATLSRCAWLRLQRHIQFFFEIHCIIKTDSSHLVQVHSRYWKNQMHSRYWEVRCIHEQSSCTNTSTTEEEKNYTFITGQTHNVFQIIHIFTKMVQADYKIRFWHRYITEADSHEEVVPIVWSLF